MSTDNITTVVFDIGNVLMTWNPAGIACAEECRERGFTTLLLSNFIEGARELGINGIHLTKNKNIQAEVQQKLYDS